MVCQECSLVFNLLDGCFGERNFTNGVTCDDLVGDKMKKLMSACRATDGIQTSAVKGARSNSVGWIVFLVGLDKAAKRMLEIDVAVQRKSRDDCAW